MKKGLTVVTKRLKMRPASEERDIEEYVARLKTGNDCYYLFGEPYSDELKPMICPWTDEEITYSLFLRGSDKLIGSVSFFLMDNCFSKWYLSFWIFEEYRQLGYATEATRALIKGYFDGVLPLDRTDRLASLIMHDNPAAAKLLQGLGFFIPYRRVLSLDEEGEDGLMLDDYVLEAFCFCAQFSKTVKKLSEKIMRPSSVETVGERPLG